MTTTKPIYTADYPSFSPFDRLALATLIHRMASAGCRMAEIGSWLGQGSTQIFLEMLRGHPGSSVLFIDTWRGSPSAARHQEIVNQFDVFGTFRANVEKAKSPVVANALMATSLEAARIVADGSFDLVFIDADHSYNSVREDIAAWRSKVRPGGILCGHDCETRVTPELRQRLMDNRDKDTIPGEGTPFVHVHPGSALAVHEAFGGAAGLFAEAPLKMPDGSVGLSTIWFVQIPEKAASAA
jgi:hypothetical protein